MLVSWIEQNKVFTDTLRNQIQTTSASPCRTQVQPAASFLVCSLIFIEYESVNAEGVEFNSNISDELLVSPLSILFLNMGEKTF